MQRSDINSQLPERICYAQQYTPKVKLRFRSSDDGATKLTQQL